MKELVGNVIYGFDEEVTAWVAARVPGYRPARDAKALGIIKDRALVAGVVYDDWNGVHVQAAIAADSGRWASRSTLFHLFHYPFVSLGCQAISVLVPSSNIPSLNLASKLGFEGEAILKFAAHDGSALVIMKMFRDKCRWIGHGEKRWERAGGA